ncbi:MAG: tetratricopeptide repeat protein, partial [Blastocatellia bacterium]
AQVEGIGHIVVTGDHNKVKVYNSLPERSAKHHLRAPVGDFVGRENEIAELIAALTNGGHASISGISGLGGIGKTELALVVAGRLRERYPDAQLLIELRGTDPQPRSAEEALAECVRAFVGLEARLPGELDKLVKLYRDCLAGKRALVVLDNAADANQVRPLLVPEGCALLVTSRETISLPKMVRIRLDKLPPDKARELLLGIAPHAAAVADQICYLCGYLPLALRAAASLLDVTPDLDPATYADELRDERARLELKYANAEGHEISVEASFQLSYARLQPDAARVFRSLAVFPASFDAAAEERVCEDVGHKHLSDLVRRNLADYDTAERRYWLHDLVRLFANSRLSDDERDALMLKHAQHFCDVLAEAGKLYQKGHQQTTVGLALYDREQGNIAAGMGWAANQLEVNWQAAELYAEYSNTGVHVFSLRLYRREHIPWLEKHLAVARQLRRRDMEGAALGNLGNAYRDLGEVRTAIEFHEQALLISREIGDRRGEGADLCGLGNANRDLGDWLKAVDFYRQCLDVCRDIGDQRGESIALGNLGVAHRNMGELRTAIEYCEQHLAIAKKIGDRLGEGNALGNLGNAYVDLGEFGKAISLLEQDLAIRHEIGDHRGEGNALCSLGNAFADLGESREAIKFYERHRDIVREIGDRRGEGSALGNLGGAYKDLGEPLKAVEFHEQYLAIAREIEDRHGEGNALGNLGTAFADLGEPRKAVEFYEQQLVIVTEINNPHGEGNALWNMALALNKLTEHERAVGCAEAALKIYEKIESPHIAMVRAQLAEWRGQG